MSVSSLKNKIRLDVITKDETAEIYVIDSSFRVVERGRGTAQTFRLKPGIYTVKIRVGCESSEKDVMLVDEPQKAEFDAIEFRSAIPLTETALTHEYHIAAAVRESRNVHIKKGKGSRIFIFARDWKPSSPPESTDRQFQTTSRPHKNITLKGSDRDSFLVNVESEAVYNDSKDAWAACNIELDAGQYRLSVELEPDKSIEQTVVACEGWQTQVFLLQRNYRGRSDPAARRADLTNTGILMSRGGFEPDNPRMRLYDLARLGLANRRQILPDGDVNHILRGKFQNPMLGILGAHLLLSRKKIKLELLEKVVANLRLLLGEGTHPDVEALALRVKDGARYDFDLPPMLRRSWMQVVDATAGNPDLIPLNSFACQNAGQMLGDEPWLLYLSENPEGRKSLEDAVRYLVETRLSREQVLPTQASPRVARTISRASVARVPKSDMTKVIGEATVGIIPQASATKGESNHTPLLPVDDKTIKNLVSDTGLPKAKIIQILNDINL